jgi:hypothetical protein
LNALRKSVGPAIADRAFAQWLARQSKDQFPVKDRKAALIAGAVWDLIKKKKFGIPRGGYLVTRGRGRVLVSAARPKR